jgi:ribosomal protein S27AE
MWEQTCHWQMEFFEISDEYMTGRSASCPRCGKWILEKIGDLEISVHADLKNFSRGQSLIGDFDIIPIEYFCEYRPESYCMTEHMVYIDFHAINSCLECGSFLKDHKI